MGLVRPGALRGSLHVRMGSSMYTSGEGYSQQKVPDRCETATSAQISLPVDGETFAHAAAVLCTGSETQSRRAGTFISMPAGRPVNGNMKNRWDLHISHSREGAYCNPGKQNVR